MITDFFTRHERLAVPLLFLIIVMVLYAPVVFFGKTLAATEYYADGITGQVADDGRTPVDSYNIDLATPAYYEAPINYLVGKLYSRGQVPLWNPYQAAGTPLAAQYSTRALFPYQILEDISPPQMWDLFMLLRLWIAGYFTYLFLKTLQISRRSAFLGGIFYMFSGAMVWFINLEQLVNVAMLVPVLMLGFEKLIGSPRPVHALLAIAGVALVLLAGNPEVAAYVLLLAGVYALLRIWTTLATGAERVSALSRLALAIALGVGFSAPLLVPFLNYAGYGHHVHPAGGPLGMEKVVQPWWAMGIANPTFFELPTWQRWPPINGVWDFLGGYSGVLPLLLAALGLILSRGRRKLLIFFGAIGLVVLLKNFGVPPFHWLGKLPLLDQVWSPRWAGPVWTFCFAAAGALGFDAILHSSKAARNAAEIYSGAVRSLKWDNLNRWLGIGALAAAVLLNRATLGGWLADNPEVGPMSSLALLSVFQIGLAAAGGFLLLTQRPVTLPGAGQAGQSRTGCNWWWLPILPIFAIAVVATNFPALLTDTHPETPVPAWPDSLPYLLSSVWLGAIVAAILLAAAMWIFSRRDSIPHAANAIIALAVIEAWFLIPRGYEAGYLALKIIPVLLAAAAVFFYVFRRQAVMLTLAVVAVCATFAIDLASPHGFPDRQDPFRPAPYMTFLRNLQGGDMQRVTATDGVMMTNFSSAAEIPDVRYMNTVVLEQYYDYTKNLTGEEWRPDDAASVVFSGRPDFVANIPPVRHRYLKTMVPMAEAFARNTRYYSLLGTRYLITPPGYDFIYSDGFGDWLTMGVPNWTSGIVNQPEDAYLDDTLSTGTWRRQGGYLGVYSDETQSLVYRFNFEEPVRDGLLTFWFTIRPDSGSARVYLSGDGENWGEAVLDLPSDRYEYDGQYIRQVKLPENLVAGSSAVFVRIDGEAPAADDGVILNQWGMWLKLAGEVTPFRYTIGNDGGVPVEPMDAFPLIYNGEVRIYENTDALPRAFFSSDIRYAATPQQAWDALQDSAAVDMNETVFCEEFIPNLSGVSENPDGSGRVAIEDYQANKVVLHASTDTPGIVVLNDSWAPGWNARVDGSPARVYRINGLVRGVYVGAGEHEVVFQYEPADFATGLFIAVLALLVTAGWLIVARKQPDNETTVTHKIS